MPPRKPKIHLLESARPVYAVVPLPPLPVAMRVWAKIVLSRRFRLLLSHPHHYVTAAGLTCFFFLTGHFETAALIGAWGYAVFENLVGQVAEETSTWT
jgi:hypothetical protein